MAIVQQARAGWPVWAELGTTDPEQASAFYGALFGWTRHEISQGTSSSYWMWRRNGLDVAGMYRLGSPLTEQGIPPHWLVYFGSDDTESAVNRAREGQGGVLFGPMDVGVAGRSAWLSDQHGAMFAVWQPKAHIGFGIYEEPGAICWVELVTPSFERSAAFYGPLFGWTPLERSPDTRRGPAKYMEWSLASDSVGGALEMTPAWKGIPPHWMPYVQVEDCEKALAVAREMGGSVAHGPVSSPGIGSFALLADCSGVHFSIIQPDR